MADEKWPLVRAVYQECGKEVVERAAEKLNDAYFMECEPTHDPLLELRLFGVLSMSRGDEWLDLLTRFLEFLRDAFKADPSRQKNFRSDEVTAGGRFSPSELKDLGRLLSFHPFEMMNLGYGSPAFVGWECGIPKGFYEIGQPGDALAKLEAMLARRYQPRLPVKLEERQRSLSRMAAASLDDDPWADAIIAGTKQARSPKRRVLRSRISRRKKLGIDLFISHSNKDRDLAASVIELLVAALGMNRKRIRCTSIAGTKLPIGVDTDHRISAEIRGAKVFIGLLTPASLRSPYVLFELGARWVSGGLFAGLLAKGASGGDLAGPISRINMLHAHNDEDIDQFVTDIATAMKARVPRGANYQTKVKLVSELSRAGYVSDGGPHSQDC